MVKIKPLVYVIKKKKKKKDGFGGSDFEFVKSYRPGISPSPATPGWAVLATSFNRFEPQFPHL